MGNDASPQTSANGGSGGRKAGPRSGRAGARWGRGALEAKQAAATHARRTRGPTRRSVPSTLVWPRTRTSEAV